jgi:hypothetical protein
MRKLIARRLTYANVISTLALFLALGGGAWAVGKTLVASSGAVFGCVRARGGVLRVVKENAHCRRGQVSIALATPTYVALHARPGARGRTGRRGRTGARGPAGPAGPQGLQGPAGPGGYAFSMGPTSSVPEQVVIAKFAGSNEMRLACGSGQCKAHVVIAGAVRALGTDARGPLNGAVSSFNTFNSETPADTTLTAINGKEPNVSQGIADISLANGTAWHLQVELASDSAGNVRLIGTAIPATSLG